MRKSAKKVLKMGMCQPKKMRRRIEIPKRRKKMPTIIGFPEFINYCFGEVFSSAALTALFFKTDSIN